MLLRTRSIFFATAISFLTLTSSSNVFSTQPIIIGIAGGSGSGKSYFANSLKETFDRESSLKVTIISEDWYYKDQSHLPKKERANVNFDHPDSLDFDLLTEHLHDLAIGKSIECPQYDFTTHSRKTETITLQPADIYIIEGILLFHALGTDLFTKSVFIDTPENTRLSRRIIRDVAERGRTEESVLEQFRKTVKPMHDLFVEPSKETTNVEIISGTENHDAYIARMVTPIELSIILE